MVCGSFGAAFIENKGKDSHQKAGPPPEGSKCGRAVLSQRTAAVPASAPRDQAPRTQASSEP